MSANPSFSIEIGERYITVSDTDKKAKKYRSHSLALAEHPANIYLTEKNEDLESMSSLIQRLVKDAGINKKSADIVVPDTYCYSQIFELPALTEKELISSIKYQADQFIPIPMEEACLDLEILSEDKKNKKISVLLVASSNSIIEKLATLIEKAGFMPNSIENECSSVLRLITDMVITEINNKKPNILLQSISSLFVNFGYSSTSLYLFNLGVNLPLQLHNFPLGFNIFLKDAVSNFDKPDAEIKKLLETIGFSNQQSAYNLTNVLSSPYNLMVSEIEKFIISAKAKYNISVKNLFIFGEGLRIQSIDKKLSASLGLPVNILDLSPFFIKNNMVDFFKNNLFLFIPSIGANLRYL